MLRVRLPDARAIADEPTARHVRLNLDGPVYHPNDAVGRLLFDVLAMVAECESDLIWLRTREGMKVAKAKGRLRGKQPKLNPRLEAHPAELSQTGEHSTAGLADLFCVGRSTATAPWIASSQRSLDRPGEVVPKPAPLRDDFGRIMIPGVVTARGSACAMGVGLPMTVPSRRLSPSHAVDRP